MEAFIDLTNRKEAESPRQQPDENPTNLEDRVAKLRQSVENFLQ